MGLLLRVLPYVRPYSRLAILSVVATIASVGLGLLLPWPLKIVVDSVLGSRPVFHEILIGGMMLVTTPVTYMLLVRAALRRDGDDAPG